MRPMSYPTTLLGLLCFFSLTLSAQTRTDNGCRPPISRRLWHDNVDKAQAAALKAGFAKGENDDVIHFVNGALVQRVDALQCKIDNDSIGDQRKIGYLRGMERMLKSATAEFRTHKFVPADLPILLDAFDAAIQLDKKIISIEPIVEKQSYEVGKVLLASEAFDGNPGLAAAKSDVVLKFANLYPTRFLLR